jgi:hypothetical protein
VTCGDCKHMSEKPVEVLSGRPWHKCAVFMRTYRLSYPACPHFLPKRQPDPTPNDLPRVHDLVLTDLEGRLAQGLRTYGVPLQPHNGRDALADAYAEALDLAMYLRQAIFERDNK